MTITSRAARKLQHAPSVHRWLHNASEPVSAYPPRAPYSRAGRGGVYTRTRPSTIGRGVPEGRGQHPNFCVLCVGADKTSMSGDVILVQVDLINDSSSSSSSSVPTGR